MKAPTFQDGAENVDVVEDGEKDEDPVEDRVELLGDEHGDGHAVADEARAPDQDLRERATVSHSAQVVIQRPARLSARLTDYCSSVL